MKKFILLCYLAFCCLSLAAVTARLSATPSSPVAGESFMLLITVDSSQEFSVRLPALPPEIKISGNITSRSFSTRIINGKRTDSLTCGMPATITASGKYTIPPLTIDFGGSEIRTNTLILTVLDPGKLPPEDRFSAQLTITPQRPVYVGELLRADVEIFVPGGQSLTRMPDFTAENFAGAIFLPQDNNGNNFVLASDPERRGKGYVFRFAAIFQVQKSGNFSPECRISLESGKNSFWGASGVQNRLLTAKAAEPLTVRPMPELPPDTIDTGLIGSWQISGGISNARLAAGEPGEIILQFNGSPPCLLFKEPHLPLTGCRSYPPEVTRNDEKTSFTVKYPFVALKAGEYTVDLPLAVFDAETGSYRISQVTLKYTVTPGSVTLPETENSADVPPDKEADKSETLPEKSEKIFRHPAIAVILLLIIIAVAAAMIRLFRQPDPEKTVLRRKLRQLIKDFNNRGADALDPSAMDTIAKAMNLDDGADFHDIAEHIANEDVCNFFRQVGNCAFMPGNPAVEIDQELHEKVIRFMKNLLK